MELPFYFCQRCMIIRWNTFSMFLCIFKKREKVFSRLLYLKHMTVSGFLPLCLLPLLFSIEKNGQRQAPTQCIVSPPQNPCFFAYPGKFSQPLKIHFPFTLKQVLSLSSFLFLQAFIEYLLFLYRTLEQVMLSLVVKVNESFF